MQWTKYTGGKWMCLRCNRNSKVSNLIFTKTIYYGNNLPEEDQWLCDRHTRALYPQVAKED